MSNDARLIRIAAVLVCLELAFLAFVYLPFMARMDAGFKAQFGCTPAEMAQQLKEAGHE